MNRCWPPAGIATGGGDRSAWFEQLVAAAENGRGRRGRSSRALWFEEVYSRPCFVSVFSSVAVAVGLRPWLWWKELTHVALRS